MTTDGRARSVAWPAFGDSATAAIGVARNRALAVNADPAFFDLGLCGPLRTDLAAAAYRGHVNAEPPFGRRPGEPPALTEADIADIVAFLRTLTDADLGR